MTINANRGRIPLKPPVRLAVLVLMFATGALLLGGTAHAAPTNPIIDTIAIDVDPTGNSGSAINGHAAGAVVAGDIQACRAVALGAVFDITVVMNALPATPTAGDRLAGFNFDITYLTAAPTFGAPPNLVAKGLGPGNDGQAGEEGPDGVPLFGTIGHDVAGSNTVDFTGHNAASVILPGSVDISLANGLFPGAWNVWRTNAFKLSQFIVGPKAGVMDWIKVRAGLTPGVYPLTLSNVGVSSIFNGDYTISNIRGATIAVGVPCPTVNPAGPAFCIVGSSTGAGWTWSTAGTNGPFSGTVLPGAVAAPGAASDIATAWVVSMNGPAPAFGGVTPTASLLMGNPTCFEISPGNQTLIVDGCPVTPSGCSFNPTVFKVILVGGTTELLVSGGGTARDTGGSASSALPYAALASGVAAAALVLATSVWYVRRRRLE